MKTLITSFLFAVIMLFSTTASFADDSTNTALSVEITKTGNTLIASNSFQQRETNEQRINRLRAERENRKRAERADEERIQRQKSEAFRRLNSGDSINVNNRIERTYTPGSQRTQSVNAQNLNRTSSVGSGRSTGAIRFQDRILQRNEKAELQEEYDREFQRFRSDERRDFNTIRSEGNVIETSASLQSHELERENNSEIQFIRSLEAQRFRRTGEIKFYNVGSQIFFR